MENKIKYIIIAVIAIIVIAGAIFAVNTLMADEDGNSPLADAGLVKSEYVINFYSDGSQSGSIKSNVETYRTNQFMKDEVNNDTIKWIESFDNNEYVYISGDTANFIMKRTDYDILKSQIDTSELSSGYDPIEYFKVTIRANMLETHSLGSGYKDVIHIENIDFVNKVKQTT